MGATSCSLSAWSLLFVTDDMTIRLSVYSQLKQERRDGEKIKEIKWTNFTLVSIVSEVVRTHSQHARVVDAGSSPQAEPAGAGPRDNRPINHDRRDG